MSQWHLPSELAYAYTPPHLAVAELIRLTLLCNFLNAKWEQDPFMKTSTPCKDIGIWGLWPVNSSSHISIPISVSNVLKTASPITVVTYNNTMEPYDLLIKDAFK